MEKKQPDKKHIEIINALYEADMMNLAIGEAISVDSNKTLAKRLGHIKYLEEFILALPETNLPVAKKDEYKRMCQQGIDILTKDDDSNKV